MNMKKMSFVLSLAVIGTLLLAACGGAGNNANGNGTPDAGAGNTGGTIMPTSEFGTTPGAGDTGGGLVDGTPTAAGGDTGGTGMDTTPTTDAGGDTGGAVDATPTVDAGAGAGTGSTDATPTAEAGAGTGTDSTPQAGIGSEMSNFALLSDLLQVSVNSTDGQQVGSVAGVVINRPIAATGGTSGTDAGAAGTGSGAEAQATPTLDIGKGSGSGSAGAGNSGSATAALGEAPSIDYVLVNVNEGLGTGSDTSGSGTGAGSTDATPTADAGAGAGTGATDATPTAEADTGNDSSNAGVGQMGEAIAVPWEAFRTQTGEASADANTQFNALVVEIDPAALAAAPRFPTEPTIAQGWDTDAQAYWSNQGLSIPATGAAGAEEGEPVVIRDTIGTLTVKGQDGQNFGQVNDFVVDLTTGELVYAVISGANANASSFYAVPVEHFAWSRGADSSAVSDGSLGAFSANFPQTAFDAAPAFTSLDEMDFSADWNTEIDTYWQSAGGMNQ